MAATETDRPPRRGPSGSRPAPPGAARPSRSGAVPAWTVASAARRGAVFLQDRGVEDARLNAEHLLAHVLAMSRLDLYLRFDRPLARAELAEFGTLLRRRGKREPLQYVMGSAQFRNLELGVGPGVAIPRPETEYMIDVLGKVAGADRVFDSALDLGTGSGAIAIALADEGLARRVVATDLSPVALEAARRNAAARGQGGIDFRPGSLLEPVAGRTFDLVLSNPPYLTDREWRRAQPEVREWEPRGAMAAGADGLDVVRGIAAGLGPALRPGGWCGLETGGGNAGAAAELLRATGCFGEVAVHEDLSGRPRYVFAQAARREPPGTRRKDESREAEG